MIETLEQRLLMSAAPVVPPAAAIVGLTAHQIAGADVVLDWNAMALQAIQNQATPPPQASRVLAMESVALFDAIDGIDRAWRMYPVAGLNGRPAAHASAQAAAIAAAATVLGAIYPSQQATFDAEYAATLATTPNNAAQAKGIAWGQSVGQAVFASRSSDGATATSTYAPAPAGGTPGQYELTPTAFAPALDPQWGQVTPWVMSSAAQFEPGPPPALDSAQYAADLNKTETLGGTDSTARTADETLYAHFWADQTGKTVTPPGHWDEIAEHISLQRHLGVAQNARVLEMLNIGLADAAIDCWYAKYVYNFWRPVTAINDPRASQINPATTADPSWQPLWPTPNFPSYMSGHSTFSGTADAILSARFGSHVHFTIGSDDMPGYTRSYTSFAAAADEAGESRVVGGIHFEFDNTAGLSSGHALGEYVVRRLS